MRFAAGRTRRLALTGLAMVVLVACSPQPATSTTPVTVFAAASLTDALGEIARGFEQETGRPMRLSFAASGAVARQIDAGAPADLVILADTKWMDRLEAWGRIQAKTRTDLLGNRLVVISGANTAIEGDPFDWLRRTGGHLAIGDPDSVPAGTYAREWLEGIGRWDALQSAIVTATDVRAVRTFVSRGEAELGIVYRSDTVGAEEIRVVQEPPAGQQPRIVYPIALTTNASPGADRAMIYLRSAEAAAIFRRHGFEPLP